MFKDSIYVTTFTKQQKDRAIKGWPQSRDTRNIWNINTETFGGNIVGPPIIYKAETDPFTRNCTTDFEPGFCLRIVQLSVGSENCAWKWRGIPVSSLVLDRKVQIFSSGLSLQYSFFTWSSFIGLKQLVPDSWSWMIGPRLLVLNNCSQIVGPEQLFPARPGTADGQAGRLGRLSSVCASNSLVNLQMPVRAWTKLEFNCWLY